MLKVLIIHLSGPAPDWLKSTVEKIQPEFSFEVISDKELSPLMIAVQSFKPNAIVLSGDMNNRLEEACVLSILHNRNETPIFVLANSGSEKSADSIMQAGAELYLHTQEGNHYRSQLTHTLIRAAHRHASVNALEPTHFQQASRVPKENFLAVMSHEIRTPMNSIIGFSDLLLEATEDNGQKDYLEIIKSNAHNLLDIFNNVLNFSRLNAPETKLEKRETNIGILIQEVLEATQVEAHAKGLDIEIDIPQGIPTDILSDYLELRQVLLNLVDNAIKFTSKGSIQIKLDASPCPEFHTTDHWNFTCQVIDTGIGIPQEEHGSIFNVFYQIEASKNEHQPGTGLGLAICKRIIKLLDGNVWCQSNPDGGTTFAFTFQAELSQPNTEKSPETIYSKHQVSTTGKAPEIKILITDDDLKQREMLLSIMEHFGYHCKLAKSGQEAIDLLNKEHYDIILLDINMPELSGLATSKLIRSAEAKQKSKSSFICALTGNSEDNIREQCFEAGMNHFLGKPLSMNALKETIQHAIESIQSAANMKRAF